MKKHLLIGLGASLLASTTARAQQDPGIQLPRIAPNLPNLQLPRIAPSLQLPRNYIYVVPTLPMVTPTEGLQAIAGQPEVWTLKRGRYDAKELMSALAAKTGGQAIFVEGFVSKPLDLQVPLQGTAPELLAKMADSGVAAGKSGPDWVFVPVQKQQLLHFAPRAVLDLTRYVPYNSLSPERKQFSPRPGQNLPPNATSFKFNGDRVYHVPIQPLAKP